MSVELDKAIEVLNRAFECADNSVECEEIKNCSDCKYCVTRGQLIDAARAVYEKLLAVNAWEGWISAKYKPPVEGWSFGCLVIIESHGKRRVDYRMFQRTRVRGKLVERWLYPWDRISDENITHWRPLPEALEGEPKEKEEEVEQHKSVVDFMESQTMRIAEIDPDIVNVCYKKFGTEIIYGSVKWEKQDGEGDADENEDQT